MQDEKIIELFFARSEEAIDQLSKQDGAMFRRVAGNILRDERDVEECLSDAYLAVWNAIPPARPDPLAAYVCRVVRNQAVKRYHRNTAQKRNSAYDVALEEIEGCFPSAESVERTVEAKEVAASIDRYLTGLDPESRILFVRRYWFSDPVADLAKRFGKSPHFISVRLYRLRKGLKKHLEKEGVLL